MRALLTLALSGLIIACGQKGPLYLPDAEPLPAERCATCPPVELPGDTATPPAEETPRNKAQATSQDTIQESTP